MRRVVLGQLLHRRGRALALLLGILVATTSFILLTGTSSTQRLQVRGTVAKAFRGDYDVLVRPRGSRDAYERRSGQVQPNFLSGVFGGISHRQWESIRAIGGVDVAAPIANVGYVLATARVPVDLTEESRGSGRALLRVRIDWHTDSGLSRVPDRPSYLYVTPNRLTPGPGIDPLARSPFEGDALREHVPGRRPALVCPSVVFKEQIEAAGAHSAENRTQVACQSRANRAGRIGYDFFARGGARIELQWTFPLLLSAVDPGEEARLSGLDRAIVDGRFLRAGDRSRVGDPLRDADGRLTAAPELPVLVSSRPLLDERAELTIERLPRRSADGMLRRHWSDDDSLALKHYLQRQPAGRVVGRRRLGAAGAYTTLKRQLLPQGRRRAGGMVLDRFYRAGPTRYDRDGAALGVRLRPPDDAVWSPVAGVIAPAAARDRWARALEAIAAGTEEATSVEDDTPALVNVGTFDPERLRTARGDGAAPATVYQPPALEARDERSARLLSGRALGPSDNLAGYLAQPPSLLTTLRGARVFASDRYPWLRGKPQISAVRVRVAGVRGPDAVSRERIRQVAERIATRTGLDVDITAGASGAPTAVDLPAGRFGRPALALTEPWIRKGVATRVLAAVDRKSLVLFTLILVVCALFVANAAGAAVRDRRGELGILSSLGWTSGRLFAAILAEVSAIGLLAGLLGGLLALVLAGLLDVGVSAARAAAAIPAGILLAALAALVPAARAARTEPIAAVRPAVLGVRRARRPRTVARLAAVNVLRSPGRSLLGALSLAIGVCALTLVVAATIAFRDTLVGTLLGDAVAVEIRASDYVAVVATVVLGLAAVADVLYLSLRERSAEFATLTATGWDDRSLSRLLICEGVWIGGAGAIAGAALGLAGAAVFAGEVPLVLVLTAVGAAAAGTGLVAVAGLAPALWLRRTRTAAVLAGE